MSFEEEFRQAERLALIDNTAQDVFYVLKDLNNQPSLHASRWIWELLQNARDSGQATGLRVSVSSRDDALVFRHNGSPFNKDQVAHLIRHGSTKYRQDGQVGRFGTGFLSTHIISKCPTVAGRLDDGNSFQFVLDRTGSSPRELTDSMNRSSEAFIASVGHDVVIEPGYTTEFNYPVTAEVREIVAEGVNSLSALAPYVLTFNPTIETIEVEQDGKRHTFRRGQDKSAGNSSAMIPVWVSAGEELVRSFRLLTATDGHVTVAVLGQRREGHVEIVFDESVPRFFVAFPLFGTEGFGFPGILNSMSFRPKPDRDGLYLAPDATDDNDTNKRLIEGACVLLRETIRACAMRRWVGVCSLCQIGLPAEKKGIDEKWLTNLATTLVIEPLRDEPLVRVLDGTLASPRHSWIPLGRPGSPSSTLWNMAAALKDGEQKLVEEETAASWEANLRSWASVFSCPVESLAETFTLVTLAEYVERLGSFNALTGALRPDVHCWDWFNRFLSLLHASGLNSILDQRSLLPDQEGKFRKRNEVSLDAGIPEELKRVADLLETPLRTKLLNQAVTCADVRKLLNTKTQRDVVTELTGRVTLEAKKTSPVAEFRTGNALLFGWLLQHEMFDSLLTFPVLSREHPPADQPPVLVQMATKDTDSGEVPLAPVECWHSDARQFADVFAQRHIADSAYHAICPDPAKWEHVASKGLFRLTPVFETKEIIGEFIPDDDLSDDKEHASTEALPTTDIAFLRGEKGGILDATRKSRSKSLQFLRFLLSHAVPTDTGWHQTAEVRCKCGKTHKYLRAAWVDPLRQYKWVYSKPRAEQASAASLAKLIGGESELVNLCAEGDGPNFLEALGISAGDFLMQSVTTDEPTRLSLSKSLVNMFQAVGGDSLQIHDLAREIAERPETVRELQERQQTRERVRRNQRIGEAVEKAFEQAFSEVHGLSVKRCPIGSDYTVGPDSTEPESDYLDGDGHELILSVGHFFVEIKATVTDQVRMTSVQAAKAKDAADHFLLCVVPLADQSEVVDASTVVSRARFVADIGAKLRPLVDGFASLELTKMGLSEADGPVRLELKGETVRYRIDRNLWESGIGFSDAVTLFGGE